MKNSTLLFLICLMFNFTTIAQTLDWAKSMGGTGVLDVGQSIAVDNSGNVYTTGRFEGTVDFDPNAGTTNLTAVGAWDIFIQKLDAGGNLIWAKSMGGISADWGGSITLDNSGNVYTTGHFIGTVDFDPNSGVFNLTSGVGLGAFIQKLDAGGNLLWAKSTTAINFGNATGNSITVDGSGNVYTTGFFGGTVDFDPNAGVFNLTAVSLVNFDAFIQKLDAGGNLLWAKSMGGDIPNSFGTHEIGNSITVDGLGNVYTTGEFWGTVDFDPNAGIAYLTAVDSMDIFIQKLDAGGNFLWAKSMGGAQSDIGTSITLDGSGNVYTTGRFSGTVDFDPNTGIANLTAVGSSDIFIQKLDAGGNLQWAKSMGGTQFDAGGSIALDGSGNIYTTGGFTGTVDFDPNAGVAYLTAVDSSDIFIQKLDAGGNLLWAKSMGGVNSGIGFSIALDSSENVYTTGTFSGTVDFDPNTGTAYLTSEGGYDIFVHKLTLSTCDTPTNYFLFETGITQTAATLQFNLTGYQLYDWRYRVVGTSTWTNTGTSTTPSKFVSGLTACTDYEWQVNLQCNSNGVWTDWFGLGQFMTECPATCTIPANYMLTESGITQTEAILLINVGGYQTYAWRYREVGAGSWTGTASTTVPVKILSGLAACTDYEWQVNLQCSSNGVWTDWFGLGQFMTNNDISLSFTVTDASCGGNDGSIDLTINGGTAPYSIMWNNGATTEDINNLSPGLYTPTITDANDCGFVGNAIEVGGSVSSVNISVNATDVSCNGGNDGSIDLTITGGTAPYNFEWSPSQGGSIEDLTSLGANIYTVTVTDANGCSSVASHAVLEPTALNISGVVTHQNIGNDGAIDVTVNGGIPPYTFVWMPSQGGTGNPTGLAPGIYNLTVTDGNVCTATSSFTVNAAGDPTTFTVNSAEANPGQEVCIAISVLNFIDIALFQYSMHYDASLLEFVSVGGFNLPNFGIGNFAVPPMATTGNINVSWINTNLSGVTLVDNTEIFHICFNVIGNNGEVANIFINGIPTVIEVGQNSGTGLTLMAPSLNPGTVTIVSPDISLSFTVTDASCAGNDGEIDLTISGGTPPYSIMWDNGATTEDINNLSPGLYTPTITDTNGFEFVGGAIEVGGSVSSVNISVNATGISCNGGNDGSIDLTITGGTAPYNFEWFPSQGGSIEDLANLSPNTYTVTVTDANGCSSVASSAISEPAALNISGIVTHQNAGNDGAIDITVNGGMPPYTFAWFPSQGGTGNPTGLAPGTYNLTVTDGNGCTSTSSFIVNAAGAPTFTFTTVNVSCNGGSNGEINISIINGVQPLAYNWTGPSNPFPTGSNPMGLIAGTYMATVTDGNGTTSVSQPITISEPPLISDMSSVVDASCNGGSDGEIHLTITGGVPPYSIDWSNGGAGADLTGLMAGIYAPTITDANDCLHEGTPVTVGELNAIPANYTLTESGITPTEAILEINVNGYQAYDWRYREKDTNPWQSADTTNTPNQLISGLIPCTQYEWEINIQCTNDEWTGWFGLGLFSTECLPNLTFGNFYQFAEEGEIIEIPVLLEGFGNVIDFQFSINWDTSYLDFVGVQSIQSNLENFSITNIDHQSFLTEGGMLSTSWSNLANPNYILDSITQLFTFELLSKNDICDTTNIGFSSTPLAIEFYNKDFDLLELDYHGREVFLNTDNCLTAIEDFERENLINIFPNPTSNEFYLNSTIKVEDLIIRDSRGSILRRYKAPPNKIDVSYLPQGIYLIEIISDDFKVIKKLIKI